ncbi:HNH endonuclease [Cryobacterium sp. CG_9.6]|uniref:HNH endonuclease n=1 Tax=Cryobacterium sp. CG_9.6 TaxID=2760710 RepID=UPI0024763155|nr:HNH endonuclease [Cryobacterium sp. CG_9.6]MDH6237822.1 5-methylcytosine-specific restriction endonuclease McrA [Cryobacterium sp. CG_9.6]
MRTLVLNAGYEPLAVVTYKRAMILVMNQKATIVQSDQGHPVFAASGVWERPSVILLSRYVRLPRGRIVPVSRRGVLRRDDHRCCYCGKSAATIDHVLPRSRGGRDTWDNLAACCLKCNNSKSDHTPAEMGWSLRFIPRMPSGATWVVRGVEHPLSQWDAYLAPAAAA